MERHVEIASANRRALADGFLAVPPHPEVPAALRKLREAGFRLFTLTNNLPDVQARQLEHAGLAAFFERTFSADSVKHHKPARQAYAYVEQQLGSGSAQFCLVACHAWDTLGAVAAGWEAALVRRAGNDLFRAGPQPQMIGADLGQVADQLIARYSR
jgi:2-haloacid dehalogenase